MERRHFVSTYFVVTLIEPSLEREDRACYLRSKESTREKKEESQRRRRGIGLVGRRVRI